VSGKETALIDMGYRSSADTVVKDLTEHGIGNDDLHYLLPTHVHLDHSGSCGTISQKFRNAIVKVHPRGEPHLSDPTRLVRSAGEVFGVPSIQKFGVPAPVSKSRIRIVQDDDTISLGNEVTLRAIWTPGHAPHHLSYLLEETGDLFTGDAVGIYSTATPVLIPTSPPPSFNLERTIDSLKRLQNLSPTKLFTPHFGLLDNPSAHLEKSVTVLLEWKQKLQQLVSRQVSVDGIVANILEDATGQVGRPSFDFPDFLKGTTRVSVLGFLGYLEWHSRQ
jgi:glyoxylase-like metal-dependent hydrolase (beta-lactamase superfamily II)